MLAILFLLFLIWTALSFLYTKVLVRKNKHLQTKTILITVMGGVASPILFMLLGLVMMNFIQEHIEMLAGNNTLIILNNIIGAILLIALPLLPVWISMKALEKN